MSANVTTPNAEVTTPAISGKQTTSTTTSTTTPASEQTTKATPPAPATKTPSTTSTTTSTTPPVTSSEQTASTAPASTAATLPEDYLKTGYFQGTGKDRYPDPALVDQAGAIAKELSASKTPPAALNRMVRTLKTAARLPYPAKQGALKKLTPQVLDLENKKKAPPLLREVVERNQQAVQNEADFAACLDHFKDIGIYLAAQS